LRRRDDIQILDHLIESCTWRRERAAIGCQKRAKVPVLYTSSDLCKSKLNLVLVARKGLRFVRDNNTTFRQEINDLLFGFLVLDIKLSDPVAVHI
jgi:hypothetical protein